MIWLVVLLSCKVLSMVPQNKLMPSRYEGRIYRMLSDEPVTPNEVAKQLGVSHKTALRTLMQLALTRGDVRYKNSGRIHLFWKVRI